MADGLPEKTNSDASASPRGGRKHTLRGRECSVGWNFRLGSSKQVTQKAIFNSCAGDPCVAAQHSHAALYPRVCRGNNHCLVHLLVDLCTCSFARICFHCPFTNRNGPSDQPTESLPPSFPQSFTHPPPQPPLACSRTHLLAKSGTSRIAVESCKVLCAACRSKPEKREGERGEEKGGTGFSPLFAQPILINCTISSHPPTRIARETSVMFTKPIRKLCTCH